MPHRLTLRPNGKIRAQRSKDYAMAINGLMTRRSFLISESPETLVADIAAIDRSLQLLGFTEDPQDCMPKRRNQRAFRRGEMIKLIRAVLRDADGPMTSREICLAILPDSFDRSDKRRVNQVTDRVSKCLRVQREKGAVICQKDGNHNAQWILRPRKG